MIFCNEVKGKSALALSRDLGVQYKTAFVLAHKLREAMATEMKGRGSVGRAGREIDGAYFGGYVKPANRKEDRKDRRRSENQSGKRRSVVVVRQRDGRTLPAAFPSEPAALSFIKARVAAETEIHADEGALGHAARPLRGQADQPPGRLQPGRHSHERGGELLQPHAPGRDRAPPSHRRRLPRPLRAGGGWREDRRRDPNGVQVRRVVGLALRAPPSVDFCGYWQRAAQH